MPRRPKKPCAYPGCPELTHYRYCEQHKHKDMEEQAQRHRYYDKHIRDRKLAEFYHSSEWLLVRQQALIRDNYLCQRCLKEKLIRPADIVHHIIEVKTDWSKRLDLDNLVSLCAACHNRVHSKG